MIRIMQYGQVANSEIFARGGESAKVEGIVSDIIANVKENGDKALFQYCEQFDQAKLDCLEVTEKEMEDALKQVGESFLGVLRQIGRAHV